MKVAFTGHRPNKLGGYGPSDMQTAVRRAISATLKPLAPEVVISGMALGVDQWAAEEAMGLGLPVVAAVPFAGQEGAWPRPSQEHYRRLLGSCRETVIVSNGGFSSGKMQRRNEWMVDNCDLLIAIWDGTSGGTANCVEYAKAKRRAIFFIQPARALIDFGAVLA